MRINRVLFFALVLFVFSVACSQEEDPTPTAPAPEATEPVGEASSGDEAETADAQPIYLSIIWHQHQPVYFKDPETNVYVRPWVRMHAAKDYVDMAAMLEQYPDIHATFNLTPSLIRQLDDLEAGAKDLYWVHTEIPADELTDEQKQFILDRFFDTNRKIIERFPRYQELLVKRDAAEDPLATFEEADYRDLQLLFNLAWTDPEWLAEEPLAALVAKGSGYSEEDKAVVLAEHLRLIGEVIPTHLALQDAGQIEITMTPFAHPILPLLVSTDLATEALPGIELPENTFQHGGDAQRQVELGVQLYEEHFGRPPQGMWPAEGSVAQEIVSMVAANGIRWMATDEGVLANSLGFDSFTRDTNDVVQEAEQLYRPYYVQGGIGDPVAVVFRDVVISDKVGFTYSGLPGPAAAQDFVNRIHDIREQLQASGEEGPFLVSVILDGENAWEHYENDGKEFLNTLYQLLSDDPLIQTVTPSEFLEIAPEQPMIEDLWAGSWINHDFSTWIGEEEENRAWDYLAETRDVLLKYEQGIRETDAESLARAQELMYIAEGSDWFWWYGADQNSGNDDIFDQQFRDTLRQVYLALGEEPPAFLDIPVIPQQAVAADKASTGLISPTIDGLIGSDDWEPAGVYLASGGVMASGQQTFELLAYGFDAKKLYLMLNLTGNWEELLAEDNVDIFLGVPGSDPTADFSSGGNPLGFPANRLVQVIRNEESGALEAAIQTLQDDVWSAEGMPAVEIAGKDDVIELALPLEALGRPDIGDNITLRVYLSQPVEANGETTMVDAEQLPGTGPASLSVPDLGTTTIVLDVTDPTGDDHGPGNYTYPTDAVFSNGNFDVVDFQVGYDEENIVFRFTMDGPVDNPWGGGNGLSLQTFDIYIDQDGDGEGGRAMLPGRNISFDPEYAWDYAITVEGWESGIFAPTADGGQEQIAESSEFTVLADSSQRKVTIRVPKAILGDTPEAWSYAAVVMSQEGYPSAGVMRVRDVMPAAEQWRIGGAPAGATNHTRVMDLVWPEEGQQETWLSAFAVSDVSQPELTANDFATAPMFQPE